MITKKKPPFPAFILDSSGSMSEKGGGKVTKLEAQKSDTKAFIRLMYALRNTYTSPAQTGIIQFNDSATVLMPSQKISTVADARKIFGKIDEMKASGSTNITAGLQNGSSLLNPYSPESYHLGMLLFSDGDWNKGGNPVNFKSAYPIYCIGFGNYSALRYLSEIAKNSNGVYYHTNDPLAVTKIYNALVQNMSVGSTILNKAEKLNNSQISETTVYVKKNSSIHVFSSNWDDPSLSFTDSTPGDNQIRISLVNPRGKQVVPNHTWTNDEDRYVMFAVDDPEYGDWKIVTQPNLNDFDATVNQTQGVFSKPDGISVNLNQVSPDQLGFDLQVIHEGEQLREIQVEAKLALPKFSFEEIQSRFGKELELIAKDLENDNSMGSALLQLHASRPELDLFGEDLVEHKSIQAHKDGHTINFDNMDIHKRNSVYKNVEITITGLDKDGEKFQKAVLQTVI